VLAETAAMIGDRQVRNRGTIGGSVSHADPAADYPTLLKALGATMSVAGKGGTREVAADDFFVDVFTTALQPGELVTSVRVPATRGAAYLKHRHPASSYAVVGVAAVVALEGGSCTDARVVVGGATGTPVTVDGIADTLRGGPVTAETAASAAERVAAALSDPVGDTYASGEYRVHLAQVLAARALVRAAGRAG
jgi:aerobic carbon-monoxide dehydrogenase medium subunit